mgnify:CR=1 FL=1
MRTDTALLTALILLAFVACPLNLSAAQEDERVRIGFVTDIHFDVPADGHRYGGVEVDGGQSNHKIPVMAKKALDAIGPDLILDTGDMTAHSGYDEFAAYNEWMNDLPAPVHALMGNHDRQHHDLSHPYGTGFYSECGYTSATRTLKMGNMVFILLSEDHKWEDHPLTAAISDQRFDWLERQIQKYAAGDNNIFILEHYPLRRTVGWSDYWYGTDKPSWAEITKQWKQILKKYDEQIVAHFSGHLHTHYAWRDTPDDKKRLDYGDGNNGVENVGHYVNGTLINAQVRENRPYNLPEMYFLNRQALAYTHGGPWRNGDEDMRRRLSACVGYTDIWPDDREVVLVERDIKTQKEVDRYTFRLEEPARPGDGTMQFMGSDLGIRKKDDNVQITKDDWFHVPAGKEGTAVFQKRWRTPVDVTGLEVLADSGSSDRVRWKASSDTGESWSDWSEQRPRDADVVQVLIRFRADDGEAMKVRDVRLETASD